MDIVRTYGVTVDVHLKTIFWDRHPTVKVSLNDRVQALTLDSDTVVSFVAEANKDEKFILTVEHWGKTANDHDVVNNLDTAVVVDRIVLNSIESRRFIWQGLYTPQYDPSYVEDLRRNGVELEPVLKNCNYLGWNGTWTLEFTAPVYTWIHNLEHLGWIYD